LADKVDNGDLGAKVYLRLCDIDSNDRVLDLYCGNGEVYFRAYEGKVTYYRGVDQTKVFDPDKCDLEENHKWLSKHGCRGYTAIDLDAYSNPYPLFSEVLQKTDVDELKVFLTDGLGVRLALNRHMIGLHCWSEGQPRGKMIDGLVRFALPLHQRLVYRIAQKNGFEIQSFRSIVKKKKQIIYSAIKLKKVAKSIVP